MRRQSQIATRPGQPAANVFKGTGGEGAGTLTTRHRLLTSAWTVDVEGLQTAIQRFTADRPLADDCRVDLFEMPGDGHRHVNVTHPDPTLSPPGWAGPGSEHHPSGRGQPRQDTPAVRSVPNSTYVGIPACQDRRKEGM